MLQLRRNYTLNHTTHRFIAQITRNYGYRASFGCFNLTAVSQCNYNASAQNDSQLVLFDHLYSSKSVAGVTIHQSYNTHRLALLSSSTIR